MLLLTSGLLDAYGVGSVCSRNANFVDDMSNLQAPTTANVENFPTIENSPIQNQMTANEEPIPASSILSRTSVSASLPDITSSRSFSLSPKHSNSISPDTNSQSPTSVFPLSFSADSSLSLHSPATPKEKTIQNSSLLGELLNSNSNPASSLSLFNKKSILENSDGNPSEGKSVTFPKENVITNYGFDYKYDSMERNTFEASIPGISTLQSLFGQDFNVKQEHVAAIEQCIKNLEILLDTKNLQVSTLKSKANSCVKKLAASINVYLIKNLITSNTQKVNSVKLKIESFIVSLWNAIQPWNTQQSNAVEEEDIDL
ncbi:MAG: hypothetical protein LBI81_01855 [Puniceicoccales bacterium]|jgi:hypothetical protein|nr:hypothetical protein [Puniceicoccales bacterium]